MTPPLRLQDLVAPLTVERFIDDHWLTGTPYLGRVESSVAERLATIEEFSNPEALMARHRRDVRVFGPNGERETVPADRGLERLRGGDVLYVDYLHRTVPEAHRLMCGLAADLGFEPWQLTMEAFAATAGAVSTRHFDHDVTIQILLDGDKEWTFERNQHITNPLQPFHPPRSADDPLAAFGEEVYAGDPQLDRPPDPAGTLNVHAGSGSSVFLPRGWWHSTRSVTDTWAVNVVFHSVSWARAFGRALEMRLHTDPRFRAYCGGFGRREMPRTAAEEQQRTETLAALGTAAQQAIDRIDVDEVPLAVLGFIGRLYRWSPAVTSRQLVASDGGWALVVEGDVCGTVSVPERLVGPVTRLCELRSNFRWDHLSPLLEAEGAAELYETVTDLARLGAIEVVHAGLGT